MNQIVVNEPNRWRLDSPGAAGWPRSPRPDAAKKYFMVSADGHANEPATLWVCGESIADGPTGFVTLHIEWSYLKANEREARPDPRRESPLAV